ncbi:hypothetical protein PN836_015010 [Ningiella sp. W23]|uniref:hypothetical protein n=1 Tax=Ningiella sp. W23 TaxID=3023715 RepID=UPI00375686C1
MKQLAFTQIKSTFIAAILLTCLFASSPVFAQTSSELSVTESENAKNKMELIQIKATDEDKVKVKVITDMEDAKEYEVHKLDLENEEYLNSVFYDLQEGTRKSVVDSLQAMANLEENGETFAHRFKDKRKVLMINTGELEDLERMISTAVDEDVVAAVAKMTENSGKLSSIIARSKAEAVLELIDSSSFTAEQLEQIQNALQNKQ